MSSEVIWLSSDEDSFIKNPNETHEVEKSAQKRKLPLSQNSSNGDAKKLKVENKESSQQGCSRDVPQDFSSGDATKQEVENKDHPRPENFNDLTHVSSNGNETKKNFEKMELPQTGCSTSFDGKKENRKVVKLQLVAKTEIPVPPANEDVFKNFVNMCSSKSDDADTRKILKKLVKSYDKLSSDQKDNSEFRLYISDCHNKVTEGLSSGIYEPISDLYNEIKKINLVKKAADNTGDTHEQVPLSKEHEEKIELLEHAIIKCKKKIRELEDADVDLMDDDENSAYIKEDKYKKKLIQLCNELSKLTRDEAMRKQILKKKIKAKDIKDEMTGIKLFDEEILNLINSNVKEINRLKYLENESFAGHIEVPEYFDVLNCIQECNKVNNLDFSETELKVKAKTAFEVVVKFLKKKRLDETKSYIQSFVENESEDPALKDENLNKKLEKSKQEGNKKLEEMYKMYADMEVEKQKSLNHLDVEKQAEASSEDESESDTENKNHDENKSFEEETNKIDGKEKLDLNVHEKRSIDNEGKIETKTQAHSKDVDETVEVIADENSDTIVVVSDDNHSIGNKNMQNMRSTNKVSTGQLPVARTKTERVEILQVDSDIDVI